MVFYCSGCFLAGEELLCCSSCKSTYFCNVECQKRCFKLHKLTCGLADPGIKCWTGTQCLDVIKSDYGKVYPGSKNTAAALKRLYFLLHKSDRVKGDHAELGTDSGDIGMELHTMTRISPGSAYYSRLWAAPGMTQLLLSQVATGL